MEKTVWTEPKSPQCEGVRGEEELAKEKEKIQGGVLSREPRQKRVRE